MFSQGATCRGKRLWDGGGMEAALSAELHVEIDPLFSSSSFFIFFFFLCNISAAGFLKRHSVSKLTLQDSSAFTVCHSALRLKAASRQPSFHPPCLPASLPACLRACLPAVCMKMH